MLNDEVRCTGGIARVVLQLAFLLIAAFAGPTKASATPSVAVVPPPDGGEVPDAALDSHGRIHLVYVKGNDAYYVNSGDQGRTFSRPLRVNSEPGTVHPPELYRGPVIAIGQDDQVHVVWWVNAFQRKRPKEEWGVYYSQLNPTRDAFLPARNINGRPSDNYSVAADRAGNVAVVWTAGVVYVNLSRDGGKSFDPPMVANPTVDSCECCATRSLFGPEDRLYALYRDKAGNMRDMYLLRLEKGAASFVRTPVSVTRWQINVCPMSGSSLGVWGSKGLVAAWEREFKIYFARMDFAGRLIPPGEIIAPGQGKYPLALSASNGVTLVAWKNNTTLNWQLYDAAGQLQGGLSSAPVTSRMRPGGVVTKDGTFVLFP
jgi:hypothetical protein